MTRAESQANLAYPEDIIDATPLAEYPNWIDRNLPFREGFVKGYKQAEKDTIAEVEKWLKGNLHHFSCWNADEFCISLRAHLETKNEEALHRLSAQRESSFQRPVWPKNHLA